MARILHRTITPVLLLLISATSLFAQSEAVETAQPLMTVMVADADEVSADMKFILGEGKDAEKAFSAFNDIIGTFLVGVDRTKPFGVMLFVKDGEARMVYFLPVKNPEVGMPGKDGKPQKDEDLFLRNISEVGVESTEDKGGFYNIGGDIVKGFARKVGSYIFFAEAKEDLLQKLPVPEELCADLLTKKYDVALKIDGAVATTEERRKIITKLRSESLAALKPVEEEKEIDFEIRKEVTIGFFDELERFFAESKSIELAWTTDREAQKGKFHVELEAMPETPLAETIAVLQQTDGKAHESTSSNIATFGSSHFVFDEMRRNHIQNLLGLLRKRTHLDITSDSKLKNGNKDKAGKIADLIFDLLIANNEEGKLNGWLKVVKNEEGQHTLIDQTAVTDASEVAGAIEESGVAEKMADAAIGDVDVYRIELPGTNEGLKRQFGEDVSLYFATGKNDLKNRVWVGMGVDALAALKAAIAENKSESNVAFQVRVDVGSWVDALVDESKKKPEVKEPPKRKFRRRTTKKSSKDSKSKKTKKGIDLGRFAWLTLGTAEDDIIIFALEKVGENKVEVNETVDTGIFRFLGKVLAEEINDI